MIIVIEVKTIDHQWDKVEALKDSGERVKKGVGNEAGAVIGRVWEK